MRTFDSDKPIYIQLAEDVMKRTFQGEFSPGDKIPSAREFASSHLVNSNTVARAYQELERSGFIVTRRGLGSFITDELERIEEAKKALLAAALRRVVDELRALSLTEQQLQQVLNETLKIPVREKGDLLRD